MIIRKTNFTNIRKAYTQAPMSNEHIAEEMKRQGKTQTQMGELLSRSQGAMSNMFADKGDPRYRPLKIEEVPLVSRWLGKSNNWVLYGKEDPTLGDITERMAILEQTVLKQGADISRLEKQLSILQDDFKKLRRKPSGAEKTSIEDV